MFSLDFQQIIVALLKFRATVFFEGMVRNSLPFGMGGLRREQLGPLPARAWISKGCGKL